MYITQKNMPADTFLKQISSFFNYLFIASPFTSLSQPTEQFIKIIVAPAHPHWIYKRGEKATFNVSVLQNGNTLKNTKVRYQGGGPEKTDHCLT